MLFKHFEYASLRCSWQIVHGRTISLVTSLWRHFHRINTKFLDNIHNLCRKACANFRASTPSCCEDIARKKTGQKYAPNGWRVARKPSGRRIFSPGLSLSKRRTNIFTKKCSVVFGHWRAQFWLVASFTKNKSPAAIIFCPKNWRWH